MPVVAGMFLNRFKYTTYSRHFTSHRVLEAIAGGLRPPTPPCTPYTPYTLTTPYTSCSPHLPLHP